MRPTGAWYAGQLQEGNAPPPDEETGRVRVYLVAGYDECLDALVPIPGQPCSSSETTQAPSRIRDAFTLTLQWTPPLMRAWDAVRAFADLLDFVQFVPGLPDEASDEIAIVELVRGLVDPPTMELCAPGIVVPPEIVLRLPKETARQALDRIFTVWVTEVRPRIEEQVDLLDPGSDRDVEAGILLACIDFAPGAAFDPASPKVDEAIVSDVGRPFLLHSQLVQELTLLGGSETIAGKSQREFATLEVRGTHTLWLWLHHPEPLEFTGNPVDALQLNGNGQILEIADVQPIEGFDNLYAITTGEAQEHSILPGMHLALQVALDNLQERGGQSLPTALANADFDYVGRNEEQALIFAVAERILPSRDLVTVTARQVGPNQVVLDLWFHTDQPVALPPQIRVQRGQEGTAFNFNARGDSTLSFAYQWQLTPPGNIRLRDGEPLILFFDTNAVQVGDTSTTLDQVIEREQLSLLGYDGDQTVRAYYRISLPQTGQTQPGPSIEDILVEMAMRLPTQAFVTITTTLRNNLPIFELWFHLDRRFDTAEAVMFPDVPRFTLFAERRNRANNSLEPPELVQIPESAVTVRPLQSNVFVVVVDQGTWAELASAYVRFAFPLEANIVRVGGRDMPLIEYVKATGLKFEGHNGEDAIVAFERISVQGVIG